MEDAKTVNYEALLMETLKEIKVLQGEVSKLNKVFAYKSKKSTMKEKMEHYEQKYITEVMMG